MKELYTLFLCFSFFIISAQQRNTVEPIVKPMVNSQIKMEDSDGHIITDEKKREAYLLKKQQVLKTFKSDDNRSPQIQVAVPLCTNGSFEELETGTNGNILKNFRYNIGNTLNPVQCRDYNDDASFGVKQYTPATLDDMASTVPSNYPDEYIGNINAYDQYALKINYKESVTTLSFVQGRRFKTNNETQLTFNYKAVLQVITDSDHISEQPYFKARVINSSGTVVSEFCLIGDEENCIFKQAPTLEAGAIVLYTPNWQAGTLDIMRRLERRV